MRDKYCYDKPGAEFERMAQALKLTATFRFVCGEGSVQRTISNHEYMRKSIDKWKEQGAADRELKLMTVLIKELA